MSYSFYSTDYGPLLRIKDGNAVLSDSLFLSSAATIMRSRTNSQSQTPNGSASSNNGGSVTVPQPSGNTGSPTRPDTPVAPEIPEDAEPAPKFSLYMGVRASAKTEITATLNALGSVGEQRGDLLPGG